MNRYDLRGRIAIVTGGAGGIGTGLARHMLDAGATVELWDRDAGGLARAAQSLASEKLATTTVDITDADLQAKAQASGNDILFTSADGATKLSHEIETYDAKRESGTS